ncbi:MAG: preQ(1) synthase [Elusimicrobiota bacterium]
MKRTGRLYSASQAEAGVDARLPDIECWENQYPGYEVSLSFPEFTSVCPRTGLPDFGVLRIRYGPKKLCLETKSLKLYLNAFRNLGIFTENAVNRVLKDVVRCAKPGWAEVEGVFAARGGIEARVTARFGAAPGSK